MISEASAQLELNKSKDIRIVIVIESNRTDLFEVFSKHVKVKEACTEGALFQNELIPNWKVVDGKYSLQVELSESSEEYRTILHGFQATMRMSDIGGRVRIERIQNERLYKQYQIERQHLYDKLNEQTEKILYHGCPNVDATLESIKEHGFDRSRAGQQTGMI